MSNRGPNVCPTCGERVSMFAAGCAICGAELDPHRADRRPLLAGLRRRARHRKRSAREVYDQR
jgi:predicted amidophosphoribosyltransferase